MKKRLETLLKLGIFAAIVMYLANKFVESSALLRKLMKTNSGKYYHWKNGSVYYKRLGTGSPLLLIILKKAVYRKVCGFFHYILLITYVLK